MTLVFVGTSGYSYDDWVGPFYPPGTQNADYLSFYSKEFNFVELNFSYYKKPDAFMLERMVQKIPDNFLFTIKAHKSMTHEISDDLIQEIASFKQGIRPLKEAQKLGAILLQFPYSFHYTPQNRKQLDNISTNLEGYPLAMEFRNNEWVKDQVIEELKLRRICYVNVDMPDMPKLLKPSDIVTSELSYIRFHGRNKNMWWQGDNVSRYDYLYSDDELNDWLTRIKNILDKAKMLLISFNNHSRGQAIQNARKMKELLLNSGLKEVY
jgi:uncharacterized protein YecE (DUF72 family)